MSTETAVEKAAPKTIGELLAEKQPDIKSLLPAHIDVSRFIKSALLAIPRNPDLKKCTPASLFTAIVNAAELGLDFTPAKRQAYLVPFFNGKKGQHEAQFMPGYGGLIELAIRGGKVKRMEAHIVHENDDFSIQYGTDPDIKHKPCADGNPGDIIGAYAVAWFEDGVQFEFMDRSQLEHIRSKSKMAQKGAWATDPEEMYRKAPLRRLFKFVPSSPDLDRALESDNRANGIDDVTPNGEGRTASLADMINADYEVQEPGNEEPQQNGELNLK